MRGDLTVRKTKTASGATAVQVVRNLGKRREILRHIGSAHDEQTLTMLLSEAEHYAEHHRVQPSLFAPDQPAPLLVNLDQTTLIAVTHRFAREALRACSRLCKLGWLEDIYLDLALMRIIPVGHFKFPHLWPGKFPRAGWVNYQSSLPSRTRRAAASLSR